MIIGAIIVGIVILVAIFFGLFHNENGGSFEEGEVLGIIITILCIIEIFLVINIIEKPTPSALDVYRGNTELEITSVNGTPIDTVVVFKKELKY